MTLYRPDVRKSRMDGIKTELAAMKTFGAMKGSKYIETDFPILAQTIKELRDVPLASLATPFEESNYPALESQMKYNEAEIAERVISTLELMEQFYSTEVLEILNSVEVNDNERKIVTDSWVHTGHRKAVKEKILLLSTTLEETLELIINSNLPEDMRAISELERAQLVALLQTTLQMLKAPLVEKGLLRKLAEITGEISKKTAHKKAEQGLGSMLDRAGALLVDLLSRLG